VYTLTPSYTLYGVQGNQILIVLSQLAVATTFIGRTDGASSPLFAVPLGAETALAALGCLPHDKQDTNFLSSWAYIVLAHRPVANSQTRIVLSSPADNRYFPEGWNARLCTQSSCPLNVHKQIPRKASHSFIVLSLEAVMTRATDRALVFAESPPGGVNSTSCRMYSMAFGGTNTADSTTLS